MASDAMVRMLALVDARLPREAVQFVTGLLDGGMSGEDIIEHVLAPVQQEVGARWEAGLWSVAQEHAATGVVQAALGVLAGRPAPESSKGPLVVACVEAEWHSLASRLLDERLRARGWDTMFLGASTPADDLHRYLADGDAVAAVLSCQMAMSLTGAARAVAAAHDAGLPVVAGGAGMGPDARRSVAIGADAWCASVEVLDRTLEDWANDPPVDLARAAGDDGAHLFVLAAAPDLVEKASRLFEMPGLRGAEVVDHLVGFAAAAVLVDDPRVLQDQVAWLRRVVLARGGQVSAVDRVLSDLREALAAGPSQAVDLVERVIEATGGTPG